MDDYEQHVHDLIGAYVLDAVTEAEAVLVEQHLSTCAECRTLEAELREVEALLPALAGEIAPPPGLKARLMDIAATEARADLHAATEADVSLRQPMLLHDPARKPSGRDRATAQRGPAPRATNRTRFLAAWAGLAALLLVAIGVWRFNANQVAKPTLQSAIHGTSAQPTIAGSLAYYADGSRLTLTVHGLKPIVSGKVYELWLIRGKFAVVTAAGTFRPDTNGSAQLTITAANVPTYNLAGVTVEKAPISTTPHLPIVATGTLTE